MTVRKQPTKAEIAAELKRVKAELASLQKEVVASPESALDGVLSPSDTKDKEIPASEDKFAALFDLVTEIAARQREQDEELDRLKKRRKKNSNVGQREGDKFVRALNTRPARVWLGNRKDPYELNFQRRGMPGDVQAVPASLTATTVYQRNLGVIFEEVTPEEVAAIRYNTPISQSPLPQAEMVRSQDNVIAEGQWDEKTKTVVQRGLGPRYVDKPGSDPQVHEQLNRGVDPLAPKNLNLNERMAALANDPEGQAAFRQMQSLVEKGIIPEDVFNRPVVVEKVSESPARPTTFQPY